MYKTIKLYNEESGKCADVDFPMDFEEMVKYRDYTPINLDEIFPDGVNVDLEELLKDSDNKLEDIQDLIEIMDSSEVDFEEADADIINCLLDMYRSSWYNIDSFGELLEALNPTDFYIYWDVDNEEDFARNYIRDNMSIDEDLMDYIDLEGYGEDLMQNTDRNYGFIDNGGMIECYGWQDPCVESSVISRIKQVEEIINTHGTIYALHKFNESVGGIVADFETAVKLKKLSGDYYEIIEVPYIEALEEFSYYGSDIENALKIFLKDYHHVLSD